MTSPKTGIHHPVGNTFPRDLKKGKKDKQPRAYFPWLFAALVWQRMFHPLKCLEDLEPKHCESQTVEAGKSSYVFIYPFFKTL